MSAERPHIAARGIRVAYRRGPAVLEGVDITAAPGEIVALLGPNGSGKSTLLRALAGDLPVSAGAIERTGPLGYAADEAVHVDALSVRANAEWFARANNAPDGPAAVPELLEAFGLTPWQDRPAGELSFGGRRKLTLVEALAHRPRVVLLDEPTVGLDPDAISALFTRLRDIAQGGVVVVAANDLHAAAALATRVAFLRAGRIVADAPPDELLRLVRGSVRIDVDLAAPVTGVSFAADVRAAPTATGYVLEAPSTAALAGICRILDAAGGRILAIRVHEADLTDAWRVVTGDVWQRDVA